MEKYFKLENGREICLLFKDGESWQYKGEWTNFELRELPASIAQEIVFDENWQLSSTEVLRSGVSITKIANPKEGLTVKVYDSNSSKLDRIKRPSTWKPNKCNGF